ncbi:hypothetical protein CBR_g10847 [Chara braunii]|uniref:CCHC-type domain-containing protein n=1 Tax=Chara braunii TaxID=69332 RepID=A0A388KPD3_CHABU|nr:hypothetical protein CBR_g10847 [Chara braunii]|eukprot:GBG71911.1 hypothetical protein CBR_g10847 [Chara braunii]
MATNDNNRYFDNRSCYNCGQTGHISRYCPLLDKRTNLPPSSSTAIVTARPLLTFPAGSSTGANSGSSNYSGQQSGQYSDRGWLRNRVFTLEGIVSKIKEKHDADEAKEQVAKEEEQSKMKEKEDEDRRSHEKLEREERQSKMRQDLNSRWEMVCQKIDKKDKECNEVAKLREEIAKLTQRNNAGEPSTSVMKPSVDFDFVERLKQEQEELRAIADKRFAMLEEKISGLVKEKNEVEADAELWKAEALRQGNKRGSIAIATPDTEARVRQRGTPCRPPTDYRVNPTLKGIVDRPNLEVNAVKELRFKDAHDKIEAEKEVERLKEAMARLEMVREKATNLKSKVDDATGPSAKKASGTSAKKKMCVVSPAESVDEREAFARMQRKQLKLNKEQVVAICDKEGITFTKL